jgi:hypothetical protein
MQRTLKTSRTGRRQPTEGGIRPSPARDKIRLILTRMISDGTCTFTAETLAELAGVSEKVASSFIAAAVAAKMAEPLTDVLSLGGNAFCLTSAYPGAPTEETIGMTSMLTMAKGLKGSPQTMVAFAYGTALQLHGLTEVSIPGFHVVKTMPSINSPKNCSQDQPFIRKNRPAKEWTRYRRSMPVFMTMRPWGHLPIQDFNHCIREGISLRVTSPLRTLVDAWMHPDWCGGEDRVYDSWQMFWAKQGGMEEPIRDLAVMLVETTWPGLWRELTRWAAGYIQGLGRLPQITQRVQELTKT